MIVFLHWWTEYVSCPDIDQQRLADQLAAAGATAVIGTHAHVLQGAGWRDDGTYVAYGLSNYLCGDLSATSRTTTAYSR